LAFRLNLVGLMIAWPNRNPYSRFWSKPGIRLMAGLGEKDAGLARTLRDIA